MIRFARVLSLLTIILNTLPASAQAVPPPGQTDGSGNLKLNPPGLSERQSNTFTISPDTLLIQGPGSTGDVSGMSAAPGDGSPAKSLAEWSATIKALGAKQAINVLDYISTASVASGFDVSAGFRHAVAAARDAGRLLIVPGLSSCYLLNSSVDISSVEVQGAGACISTTASVSTFVSETFGANIHGLRLEHTGATGSVFRIRGQSHKIHENKIDATHTTNPDPIIYFNGSNVYIYTNLINNFRPNAYTWKLERSAADLIAINDEVRSNYFGGTGKGGWVGDTGQQARPEGIFVGFNSSVLSGGPFLTFSSVLSARVIGNMMDQGPAAGALRFEPGGFGNQGIDGVLVQGNYISAVGVGPNPAIQNQTGTATASGLSFVGNQIAYGSKAAKFVPGVSTVTFSGNYMHGFSADHAIELSDASLLTAVKVGDPAQYSGTGGILKVTGPASPGAQRTTIVAPYDTATGGGFLAVAHKLAAIPTKFRVSASTVGSGGAALVSVAAHVVVADSSNLTLSVSPTGIATQGIIWFTVESEI